MKVAVIGRGSGGLITAMNLLTYNLKVDVYYDPETSQLPVGESTTPQFASLIECTLGLTIDDLISLGLASYKKGIEFVDWGNTPHFFHKFLTWERILMFISKRYVFVLRGDVLKVFEKTNRKIFMTTCIY